MCLYLGMYDTKKKALLAKKELLLVAEKDIKVHKILRKEDNRSPYKGFIYEKGMLYYEDKNNPFDVTITWGYYMRKYFFMNVERGLHSYKDKILCREINNTCKVVTMYIPKGSRYYISSCGNEIVSEQLMWI